MVSFSFSFKLQKETEDNQDRHGLPLQTLPSSESDRPSV